MAAEAHRVDGPPLVLAQRAENGTADAAAQQRKVG